MHVKDPSPYYLCQLFKGGFFAEYVLKHFKAMITMRSYS